jgi:hypothetical protein
VLNSKRLSLKWFQSLKLPKYLCCVQKKSCNKAWEKIIEAQKAFFIALWGEIMVKKARGAKVKVIFQGLHMTHVIFVLVYNLKFCISNTPFKITF